MATLSGFNSQFVSFTYNPNTTNDVHSQFNTNAAAFETANGESILVYYNPNCTPNPQTKGTQEFGFYMCANFVYDLNGNKGPNTVGKDIGFITAFYPSDPVVVSPMPYTQDLSGTYSPSNASKGCTNFDSESRLPNIDELSAISCNRELLGLKRGSFWYISSSRADGNSYWYITSGVPVRATSTSTSGWSVKCVKR